MRAYLAVLLIIALSLPTLGFTSVDRSVTVGVYFYVWYSSDGRHWDPSVDPVWAVVEQPVIRFYDSRDESVIKWQLKLIRDAGIDFIVISWWGPGSFEDEAAKAVVKHL
ncbi:MAG: hypothetical protein QW794_04555, partial [Thermosphaera sp.]